MAFISLKNEFKLFRDSIVAGKFSVLTLVMINSVIITIHNFTRARNNSLRGLLSCCCWCCCGWLGCCYGYPLGCLSGCCHQDRDSRIVAWLDVVGLIVSGDVGDMSGLSWVLEPQLGVGLEWRLLEIPGRNRPEQVIKCSIYNLIAINVSFSLQLQKYILLLE